MAEHLVTVERILVTGATGYIGRHVLARLRTMGWRIRATHRKGNVDVLPHVEWLDVGDIGPGTDWSDALRGVDVIIHLAGRAHSTRSSANDKLAEFRLVNVGGTEQLARKAKDAGVRRLVFVSSVKVNGERTVTPFAESDPPHPEDAYGISKLEAEETLLSIQQHTHLEVVIVRPPLVFGAEAPGNFGRLLRAVKRGIPMPFGAINNRRSLLNVHNLVDFLLMCCEHPRVARQTFLVSDGYDISTTDLLLRLAIGMGVKPRLFPVPANWLRVAGRALGRGPEIDRLCSSLQVNTAKARDMLRWQAPISLEEGLISTAREFMRREILHHG